MEFRALTANLGLGARHQTPSRDARREWLEQVAGHQVLFLQEMPRDRGWADDIADHGWQLVTGTGRTYNCRSAIAVDREWSATTRPIPNAEYHGTYVAAAEIEPPGLPPILAVSVHASPKPLTEADHAAWDGQVKRLREPSPGQPVVWHSDQILTDLESMIDGPTLVAGDLNEARGWDDRYGGRFGADWFAHAEDIGLHDLVHPLWEAERPTRGDYQIDHVLGTSHFVGRVRSPVFGPESWSDHQCISVTVDLVS